MEKVSHEEWRSSNRTVTVTQLKKEHPGPVVFLIKLENIFSCKKNKKIIISLQTYYKFTKPVIFSLGRVPVSSTLTLVNNFSRVADYDFKPWDFSLMLAVASGLCLRHQAPDVKILSSLYPPFLIGAYNCHMRTCCILATYCAFWKDVNCFPWLFCSNFCNR